MSKVTALHAVSDVAYDLSRFLFALVCSKYTDRTFFSSIMLTMIESYALNLSQSMSSDDEDLVTEGYCSATVLYY